MKYRTKPIAIIEAVQWKGHNEFEVQMFVEDGTWHWMSNDEGISLYLESFDGLKKVNVGDYVVKGMFGNIHACSKDEFESMYEKVEEQNGKV